MSRHLHCAGLIRDGHASGARFGQRLAQQTGTKHLRRLRQPYFITRQSACHPFSALLDGICRRQGQQAATGIGQAGVYQACQGLHRQARPGGIMHQNPVALAQAGMQCRIGERIGHGIGAFDAAARTALDPGQAGQRLGCPAVAGRHRDPHLAHPCIRQQGLHRQAQHGFAA